MIHIKIIFKYFLSIIISILFYKYKENIYLYELNIRFFIFILKFISFIFYDIW